MKDTKEEEATNSLLVVSSELCTSLGRVSEVKEIAYWL